jgi:hypothetical protein
MAGEVTLLSLLSSRELAVVVLPLKSPYSEIELHRIDLSAYFSFPGARELIHIAVSPSQLLDDQVYDMIDEQISSYGFNDRPKIIEFTEIATNVRELLRQFNSIALIDRAELRALGKHQALRSYLRKLFAASFSLRILNPYVFRGPVTGRRFFGRDDEISALRSQTQRSYVISGARRSGKSSLLIETKRRLDASPQSDEVVIYLTFENCNTLGDLPQVLLKALPNENDDYVRLANSTRWKLPQNLHRLVDPLSKYLQGCRKRFRLIRFFFDEYDKVISLERGHARSGLTGVCRELLAAQKAREGRKADSPFRVQFAFAGSTLLYDELLVERSPIFNFATKLQLRNFDLKSLTSLVTMPLRDLGVEVDNPQLVAQTMLDLTGGHPSTSQHLCSILVEHLHSGENPQIGVEHVRRAGRNPEFLEEFAAAIDHNISSLGRFVLVLIAKSQRPLFEVDHFRRSGEAIGIRLDRDAVGLQLAGLADSGYLTAVEAAHRASYRLAIPTVKQVYSDFDPKELIPDMLAEKQCTRITGI